MENSVSCVISKSRMEVQQGKIWRSQRSETPNPVLLLKALKSSKLYSERALQQHPAPGSSGERLWIYTLTNNVLVGSGQRSLHWYAGKLGRSVIPV